MITDTPEETAKYIAETVDAQQSNLINAVTHVKSLQWMAPLDEREKDKPDHLAYQGPEFASDAQKTATQALKFFLAWGYEAAVNPDIKPDVEYVSKKMVDIEATEKEIAEIAQERCQLLAEGNHEERWLDAWVLRNYRESLCFYESQVKDLRRKFNTNSKDMSGWGRSMFLHSFEISARELYSIGLRLGPAMQDLEILRGIDHGEA